MRRRIVVHNYLPTRDAGRVTHTFGSRLAEANKKANANAEVPKEEWARRRATAEAKFAEARAEGERRKDSRGAYPKDVIKRMNALQKEIDLARQFGSQDGEFYDFFVGGPLERLREAAERSNERRNRESELKTRKMRQEMSRKEAELHRPPPKPEEPARQPVVSIIPPPRKGSGLGTGLKQLTRGQQPRQLTHIKP